MDNFRSRFPFYKDDADYTTNAPSYYDDLARKNKLIQYLTEKILKLYEDTELTIEQFNKRLDDIKEEMKDFFGEWLKDGTLEEIINNVLFEKLKIRIEEVEKNIFWTAIYPSDLDDDVERLNSIINKEGNFLFKKGTYNLGDEPILAFSNSNYQFEKGAKLVKNATNATNYYMFKVNNIENVQIDDINIIGDRYSHIGSEGEWGYGLEITNAKNIIVNNPIVSDTWGDGIYLGHEYYGDSLKETENIVINNAKISNCRRNGLSITGGRGLRINNPIIKNINGTSPQAGIDVEVEGNSYISNFIEDLVIQNPYTEKCKGAGITINLYRQEKNEKPVHIVINNSHDEGSLFGNMIQNNMNDLKGTIIFNHSYLSNNKLGGFLSLRNSGENSLKTIINDLIVKDSNRNDSKNYPVASAIAVTNSENLHDIVFGNITFNNPTVIDSYDLQLTLKPFFAVQSNKDFNKKSKNIILNNLTTIGLTSKNPIRIDKNVQIINTHDKIFKHYNDYYELTVSGDNFFTEYKNADSVGTITIKLSNNFPYDIPVSITHTSTDNIARINVISDSNIFPIGKNSSDEQLDNMKKIGLRFKGSSIKLVHTKDGWFILERIGTHYNSEE